MPRLLIKDFILDLLDQAEGPLSTTQIYEAFDNAGYDLTTSSIRGRLNTLTYEGQIIRVGFGTYAALSRRFFNLLVSANSEAWDRGFAEIDRSRFLEYTGPEIKKRFESLVPNVRHQILKLPTVFAYEFGVKRSVRIGHIKDLHAVRRGAIDIWFEFDEGWPEIESALFQEIRNSFGFEKNEEYRTHWAIKEIDLYAALSRHGINKSKKTLSGIESSPAEPPPGPGPQYAPVNGKLSEIASHPGPNEIASQSQLHERLRDDALALARRLEPIGNRYPSLLRSAKEYSAILNVALREVDVTGLWSVGGSLVQYAASYRAQNIARTLSEPLEPEVEAQLQNLVRQHGAFVMGFREGRDLVERADEFLVGVDRLREIEGPGNVLLSELADNRELVDDRTRALHRTVRDSVAEFGWTSSRVGYSAYLIVRNSIRIMIKYTIGENPNAGVLLGLLSGASALAGDPNAEFIRTAVPVLQQHGAQLLSFFGHSPEMHAYVDWALRLLESDRKSSKH